MRRINLIRILITFLPLLYITLCPLILRLSATKWTKIFPELSFSWKILKKLTYVCLNTKNNHEFFQNFSTKAELKKNLCSTSNSYRINGQRVYLPPSLCTMNHLYPLCIVNHSYLLCTMNHLYLPHAVKHLYLLCTVIYG